MKLLAMVTSSLISQQVAPSMAAQIDLTGKVAFVAGVADSTGYGWAICKALANAGATITVGTWPPVLGIFEKSLSAGKFDEDMVLDDGSKMKIAKVYFWGDSTRQALLNKSTCYECCAVKA